MSTSPRHLNRTPAIPVARPSGARSQPRVVSVGQIARAEPRAKASAGSWLELVTTFRAGLVQLDLADLCAADVVYIPEAFAHGVCPDRFPARLTALLYERYVAFHGDSQRGVTFLSSDHGNSPVAEVYHCVLEHAQNWALPGAFAQWITNSSGLLCPDAVASFNTNRHPG